MRGKELTVRVRAAQAIEVTRVLRKASRACARQGVRVPAVFAADRHGDCREDADRHPGQEQHDRHNDDDTGHDGLRSLGIYQHLFPDSGSPNHDESQPVSRCRA